MSTGSSKSKTRDKVEAATDLSKKPSSSKIPKKIDFRQPELPQKRIPRKNDNSDNAKSTTSVKTKANAQNAPTSSSNGRNSSSVRPPSQASTRSKADNPPSERRPESPDTDEDGSIAESIKSSGKIRRTETERILYFRNQPECAKLEPRRVLCTRCNSYVNLGQKQTYSVRPWESHRIKCDARAGDEPHGATRNGKSAEVKAGSTGTPSTIESPIRRNESERKAFLESDSRAEEIRPDQVKCRTCKKWVRLSTKLTYALYHWQRHQETCGIGIPSSRVTTAERKLQLVNDADAKSFGTRHVECSQCGLHITLEGDGDYNLTKWEEHKINCPSLPQSAVTESTNHPELPEPANAVPFPIIEDSANNTESKPAAEYSSNANLKRGRSESDATMDRDDERPLNRPRTASYVAPEVEAPSALGWFLLPLKSFVRGFRESLRGDSQPNA
ncbi:hypothetical protein AX17_002681 [Amanita inopinata Kibby_2008]|nr:hypothetical protein AX17_002681 [Amanita inopinata Kibby_2008]